MKQDIHPTYEDCAVKCSCGNEFTTRSTIKKVTVQICSNCHPFFTGKQKLVDSAGRVEKFMRRYRSAAPTAAEDPAKAEVAPEPEAQPEPAPELDAQPEPKAAAEAAEETKEAGADA